MHLIISMVNLKSNRIREIICGKPRILVYRGKIDEKALKKERFSINELQEKLRSKDIMNLGDVEFAILETSGEITVVQKPEKRSTIPEDFGIVPEYEGISYDLIVDGKIMEDNIVIDIIEFTEELYKKNIKENSFVTEYEAGEDNANN